MTLANSKATTNKIASTLVNEQQSTRSLFANLFDYAGLFPPAGLSMEDAVANYVQDRNGAFAWMLNAFVVSAKQLDEFATVAAPLMDSNSRPFKLSVLSSDAADTQAIAQFCDKQRKSIVVKSVETKLAENAESLLKHVDCVYIEIPSGDNLIDRVKNVQAMGACAKIRTGGLTAEAFPSCLEVARFLVTCQQHDVAFKATAGLHHPLRSTRPVSSAPNAPTGAMHGFVNVLLAVSKAEYGASIEEIVKVLDQPACDDFQNITAEQASRVRGRFHSIGSCSFTEPVDDLKELGWL